MARFTKSQCRPCPARTQCTTTADSARTVGFPPRELRDLQLRVRSEQQTLEWKTRYAVRSGVEGTINEFAHGYGMRRCCYRGQGKAHIQHVLTAIAVNIERLSQLPPTEESPAPRRPTPSRTTSTSARCPGRSHGEPWAPDLDGPRSPAESSSRGCVDAMRQPGADRSLKE
ncbi:transposase (plasmid) [Streptomyces sp. NBC_00440]|uniref:transposase n=1 Tax=unclassified Streptomyces TaxID=2593676 RepID=UPI002E2245C8|nr:transposase [Streptomyces sp. NBC_00963]